MRSLCVFVDDEERFTICDFVESKMHLRNENKW